MATSKQSIIEARRDQIFPVLEPAEIERIRRFGTAKSYSSGQVLAQAGKTLEGLTVILSGTVNVTRHTPSGDGELIVAHGPGSFLGELAQLSGRPALVDARAQGPVDALIIPPDRLRALLVAEAELGERIMRALILRRVVTRSTGDHDRARFYTFVVGQSKYEMIAVGITIEANYLIRNRHFNTEFLRLIVGPRHKRLA